MNFGGPSREQIRQDGKACRRKYSLRVGKIVRGFPGLREPVSQRPSVSRMNWKGQV